MKSFERVLNVRRLRRKITDGGAKSSGFENERKDCTVRAMAILCDIPYSRAHALLKAEGRQDNAAVNLHALRCAMWKAGKSPAGMIVPTVLKNIYHPHGYYMQRMTHVNVKTFVESLGPGRYLISIKKHVFAVIDGVIHDSFKQHAGAQVRSAWRVQ